MLLTAGAAALLLGAAVAAAAPPAQHTHLAIDRENPAYFRFRGRAAALVSSGEHYGGLINLQFNYTKYFDALAADGFTLTQATLTGSPPSLPLSVSPSLSLCLSLSLSVSLSLSLPLSLPALSL